MDRAGRPAATLGNKYPSVQSVVIYFLYAHRAGSGYILVRASRPPSSMAMNTPIAVTPVMISAIAATTG